MENYTIDLAQLGQRVGGAPKIGSRPAKVNGGKERDEGPLYPKDNREASSEEDGDFMGGYEINMGAFGDKPSSVVIEDREQQRDEIDSEDDGPDDFTVNLEKWMRGTEKWKKKQDEDSADDGSRIDEDAPDDGQDGGSHDADAEESVFEPLGTSTPAPLRNQAIIEEGVQQEASLLAPPLSRMNTETLQDRAAEEVFERISALQAETERMQAEEESRRSSHRALEEENAKLKRDLESTRQRHEARDRVLKGKFEELQRVHADTKSLLQDEKDQLRQDYESALARLRSFEQRPTPDNSSELEPLRRMYEDAVQESESVKREVEANRVTTDSEIEALETDVQNARNQSQQLRTELESFQDAHSNEIKDLKAELEARENEVALERKESIQRANELAERDEEHAWKLAERDDAHARKVQALHAENRAISNELEHAQEQLTETRRIVDTVEEENDRLVQQNNHQGQDITELKAIVKDQELKAVAPESKLAPAVNNLDNKAALETPSKQHQAEISSLQATHANELQALRTTLLKAGQAMQKREVKLNATHANEIASLNQELTTLQSYPSKTPAPIDTGIEIELRSAIRVLNTRLSTANAALKTARTETLEARQKVEDAHATNALVNAELEARFAEMVEARETEWRRRVSLLFRERDMMGKALMWGWGREEVGIKAEGEREQGYRYKYVCR